ncbi:putative adult brain protein 239 [Balamuthia mandrillaris]
MDVVVVDEAEQKKEKTTKKQEAGGSGRPAVLPDVPEALWNANAVPVEPIQKTKHYRVAPPVYLRPDGKKRVRVVCVSDTHHRWNDLRTLPLPDGDIFLHCGDFSNRGAKEEWERYSSFLASLPHKHKVLICGNHDYGIDHLSREEIRGSPLIFPQNCNVHYLQDDTVTLEGIKFWGSPWTGHHMAFHVTHDGNRMRAAFSSMPEDVDIAMTHLPPFNVLDLAWLNIRSEAEKQRRNVTCQVCGGCHPSFDHWGSRCLRHSMLYFQPKVHVFGHVHDAPGMAKVPGCETLFVNAAMDLYPRPIVIDCYL